MKTAIELISEERARQICKEGWTAEHDDGHDMHELARAARCYALPCVMSRTSVRGDWPWSDADWKPSDDPIRNLVKAGALIVAEIDRLQRLTPQPEQLK